MSRSGYSDCDEWDDNWAAIHRAGAVKSAIKGKRGQAFLKETLEALDAMPEKRLISEELEYDGDYCTLGAVGANRGIDTSKLDPYDYDSVAGTFGISPTLAREIMYWNDSTEDDYISENVTIQDPVRPWEFHIRIHRRINPYSAERRWKKMREWVAKQIKE